MKKIWVSGLDNEKNISIAFVHSFIPKNKNCTKINIAGQNSYQLFVNGVFFGYHSSVSAEGICEVAEYSLASVKGRQVNVVVLVNGRKTDCRSLCNNEPFFAINIFDKTDVLATTDDFKAYYLSDRICKTPRFNYFGGFIESYAMSDKRKKMFEGINKFGVCEKMEVEGCKLTAPKVYSPKKAYENCTCVEFGSATPNAQTFVTSSKSEFDFEFNKDEIEDNPCEIAFDYKKDNANSYDKKIKDGYQTFDFGKITKGFFSLELSAIFDSDVYIYFDQKKSPLDNPVEKTRNIIKYKLESGDYKLFSSEPYCFRYAKIVVCGEVKIKKFCSVSNKNIRKENIKFSTADKDAKKLFDSAKNNLRLNTQNILTFSPTSNAGSVPYSIFSGASESLIYQDSTIEENFMTNFFNFETQDDIIIPKTYPASNPKCDFLPIASMFFVLQLSFYQSRTKNYLFVEKFRNKILETINYFAKKENEDGLLCGLDYRYSNSQKADDKKIGVLLNILYCKFLREASKILCNREVRERSNTLQKKIFDVFYNGEKFCDTVTKTEDGYKMNNTASDISQYCALAFSVATKEEYPKIHDYLLSNKLNEDYNDSQKLIRFEYLLMTNNASLVFEEIKELYLQNATKFNIICNQKVSDMALGHNGYIANLVVACTTGLFKIDHSQKKVYFVTPATMCKSKLELKTKFGKIKVSLARKKLCIKLPQGYEAVYFSEENSDLLIEEL